MRSANRAGTSARMDSLIVCMSFLLFFLILHQCPCCRLPETCADQKQDALLRERRRYGAALMTGTFRSWRPRTATARRRGHARRGPPHHRRGTGPRTHPAPGGRPRGARALPGGRLLRAALPRHRPGGPGASARAATALLGGLGWKENRQVAMASQGAQAAVLSRRAGTRRRTAAARARRRPHRPVPRRLPPAPHDRPAAPPGVEPYTVSTSDVALVKLQRTTANDDDLRDIVTVVKDAAELGASRTAGRPRRATWRGSAPADWGLHHDVARNLARCRGALEALGRRPRGRRVDAPRRPRDALAGAQESRWRLAPRSASAWPGTSRSTTPKACTSRPASDPREPPASYLAVPLRRLVAWIRVGPRRHRGTLDPLPAIAVRRGPRRSGVL